MKKWVKITLSISGVTILAFAWIGLPIIFQSLWKPNYSSEYPRHVLTKQKVEKYGLDKKSEITLEDLNRDFPGITIIDKETFKDNIILTKIQIPKEIKYIYNGAFENSSLNTIEFEQNSKLQKIYRDAFKNTKIKSIDLPDGIHSIYDNVFQNTEIENFYFPSKIFWVGNSVFEDCDLLKEVSYTKGMPSIMGKNVFKNTNIINYDYRNVLGLSTFAFNNSLQHIDFSNASFISPAFFSNLLSDIDVLIPNSILMIFPYAFSDSNIKSVTFENYTNSDTLIIADYVFANCYNLKKLQLPKIIQIGLNSNSFAQTHFDDITMPSYLKVNDSSIPLYGFTQTQWDLIKWI